ncbi:MAG: dephospho-CoA kinase [Mangrovibacterium sp.]
MKKLGITGGIGSGKSTICKLFKLLGIPVYDSDINAKILMNSSLLIKEKLQNSFGDSIYFKNNELDRKKLASIVFNSPTSLATLNAIVHPEVRADFERWCALHADAPYVIQESAILFDSGLHRLMNKTLTVTAPLQERIDRVMNRDRITKELVVERINNQMTDEERMSLSDFIIKNGKSDLIIAQVLKINQILQNE